MRWIGARIGVSVAIAVLAPHVSHDVCAFVTRAAHDVGAHRDAIPDLQWSPVELKRLGGLRSDLRNHANVLVALNDREWSVSFGGCAGVLLHLTEVGVFVCAAYARHLDLHEQRAVLQFWIWEILNFILTRCREDCGANVHDDLLDLALQLEP